MKQQVDSKRRAASERVLEFVDQDTAAEASRLATEQLLDDLPEVKGLFSRAWRQDQWDWFTVWEQLGRPGRPRARAIADALGHLRKCLRDHKRDEAANAVRILRVHGGPHFLRTYLRVASELPSEHGYLYILSTRHMPRLLKIGYTERSVRERVNELNAASAVVLPYGARAVWVVKDARRLEAQVHQALDLFRVRRDREFFELDFREAFALVNDLVRRSRAEAG